jgi:hypothetical protein
VYFKSNTRPLLALSRAASVFSRCSQSSNFQNVQPANDPRSNSFPFINPHRITFLQKQWRKAAHSSLSPLASPDQLHSLLALNLRSLHQECFTTLLQSEGSALFLKTAGCSLGKHPHSSKNTLTRVPSPMKSATYTAHAKILHPTCPGLKGHRAEDDFHQSPVTNHQSPCRPIAPNLPWCNNWHRCENSSPTGETTPLPPVSKDSKRTSGTVL